MGGLRVAALGSGSAGNSTLICTDDTTLLLDCGFTLKESLVRLQKLSITMSDIDGIIITHEHGDHVRGVGPIVRKFNLPVWMTHGTFAACRDKKIPSPRFFNAHEPFTIGDIDLDPFPTPHDAAESCQFVFRGPDGSRFACVTDLGACTPHVKSKILGVQGILVESNYDDDMLRNGPYPPSLQYRISSNYGHLGNQQAGALLAEIDHDGLQTILLGHLSERNNTDDRALDTVKGYLDKHSRITVLQQHECSRWFAINEQVENKTVGTDKADISHGVDREAMLDSQPA